MADETDNINIGVNIDPARAEGGSRRASKAVGDVGKAGDNLQKMYQRIRTSIDPLYAAQQKYNRSFQELRELFAAGTISGREFGQLQGELRAKLAATTAEITRNSAAARAAAAEQAATKAKEVADAKSAAAETARVAREKAAAEKQAAKEAAAEVRRAKAEERAAIREAAAEAKRLAREKAAAERVAANEEAEAQKQAKREETEARREAARVAKQAARDKETAERNVKRAAREAAEETRRAAAAERQHANALTELRASIDPVFAAQTRYNNTMAQATQLLMQNKLQQGEWNRIQAQAKAQMDVNVRSLGRMNSVYVQMGYQAQDVTASLASGINPLVILAQQGGQTAAALSQMGGTVGRVASFMAGPWGAAILGFTMLIGMLAMRNKEAEKNTIDLMNAESRRKATLEELTEALREFNKAQREANTNESEALRLKGLMVDQETSSTTAEMAKAQARLNELKKDLAATVAGGAGNEASAGVIMYLNWQISRAQSNVDALKKKLGTLGEGDVELSITRALRDAEAAADPLVEVRQRAEAEEARITNIQRQQLGWVRQNLSGAQRLSEETRINLSATRALTALKERLARREKEIADAAKASNDEYGKGVAIWKSREQAIGAAGKELIGMGFRVSENAQFGGVKGNHPGMGNAAHGKFAADVNIGSGIVEANDPGTRARVDTVVRSYQARGYRIVWNGRVYEPFMDGPGKKIPTGQNQHRDHFHLEAPASIVGKPTQSGEASETARIVREAEAAEKAARKDMLDSRVEDINYSQTLAENDFAEQMRLQDEKIAALREYHGEDARETIRAQREKATMQRRHDQDMLRIQRDAINTRVEIAQSELDTQREIASAGLQIAEQNQSVANTLGTPRTGREEIEARRAILNEQFRLEQSFQERIYALKLQGLRDELALLDSRTPEYARVLNAIAQLEAAHGQQMRVMHAQNSVQQNALNVETIQESMAGWKRAADSISGSLNTAFQNIWTRQGQFGQDMLNLADQLVYQYANAGLKMISDWAINEARKTAISLFGGRQRNAAAAAEAATDSGIQATKVATAMGTEGAITAAKQTGDAIRTASAASAAGTQSAVSTAAGTAEIGNQAAQAAAGAYKSTVVIPFIGPIAAPAAAALALGAVMGFTTLIRSAKGGYGTVEGDQLMQVHNKEMILPAYIAEPFRQSLRRPSSSGMIGAAGVSGAEARAATHNTSRGGDANFYYQPQNSIATMGFDDLLRRDGATLRKWLRNQHRNGNLKG